MLGTIWGNKLAHNTKDRNVNENNWEKFSSIYEKSEHSKQKRKVWRQNIGEYEARPKFLKQDMESPNDKEKNV